MRFYRTSSNSETKIKGVIRESEEWVYHTLSFIYHYERSMIYRLKSYY